MNFIMLKLHIPDIALISLSQIDVPKYRDKEKDAIIIS